VLANTRSMACEQKMAQHLPDAAGCCAHETKVIGCD